MQIHPESPHSPKHPDPSHKPQSHRLSFSELLLQGPETSEHKTTPHSRALAICSTIYTSTQNLANIPANRLDRMKKSTDAFVLKAILGKETFDKATESSASWKKELTLQARFGIQLLRTVGDGVVGPFVMMALLWKAGIHIAALPMHLIATAYQIHTDGLQQTFTKKDLADFAKSFLSFSLQMLTSGVVSALVYGSIATAPVSLPIVSGAIAIGVIAALLLASHIEEAINEVDPKDWGLVAEKVAEKSFESLLGVTSACVVGIACGGIGAGLFPLLQPSLNASFGTTLTNAMAPASVPIAATPDEPSIHTKKPSIDPDKETPSSNVDPSQDSIATAEFDLEHPDSDHYTIAGGPNTKFKFYVPLKPKHRKKPETTNHENNSDVPLERLYQSETPSDESPQFSIPVSSSESNSMSQKRTSLFLLTINNDTPVSPTSQSERSTPTEEADDVIDENAIRSPEQFNVDEAQSPTPRNPIDPYVSLDKIYSSTETSKEPSRLNNPLESTRPKTTYSTSTQSSTHKITAAIVGKHPSPPPISLFDVDAEQQPLVSPSESLVGVPSNEPPVTAIPQRTTTNPHETKEDELIPEWLFTLPEKTTASTAIVEDQVDLESIDETTKTEPSTGNFLYENSGTILNGIGALAAVGIAAYTGNLPALSVVFATSFFGSKILK